MRVDGLTNTVRLAALGVVSLLVVACSGNSDSTAPSTTRITVAPSTSILVPNTPTITGDTIETEGSTTTSTSAPIVVVGLPTSVVFPAIEVIDPTLSLRTLAPGDLDRLEARFRQDERVDVFLEEVDARGVYKDDELVAVAVAVAVTPGAASTAGFIKSFEDGAVAGGVRSPVPVVILDQELESWLSADTGHLLWSFENIFLIISGRDAIQVRDIASAVVTMVISPPLPPPELPACGEHNVDPDGEAETDTEEPTDADVEEPTNADVEEPADADSGPDDGDDPVVENCVPLDDNSDTTTTTVGL